MQLIIWGIFMCILGLIDLMGADWRVGKAYRKRPERKVWQRKMAIAEFVSGISGGISHFIDNKWGIIITGVIGISAIIFIGINNRRFYKEKPINNSGMQSYGSILKIAGSAMLSFAVQKLAEWVRNMIDERHEISMRKCYVDNMRWMIILLLVPYHAAMAWNVWGEPNYIYFESNKIISSIVVFLSPYFMPLMFLLAGISTRFALQKRTIGQYVSERAKKLLIPFIFGTMLIMPPMTYIADKFNCGYQGNFFRHYAVFFTHFTDLTGADGSFSVGQFWFILYLFFISLVAAAIIFLQNKIKPQKHIDMPFVLIFLWGLPLPFFGSLLSIGGKSFVEYTYVFLAGYYIFSSDDVISKVEKWKWIFLCIGITATVFNVYLFVWSDTQQTWFNTTAKYASEWLMINSLLGIGKSYLDFNGKISKYMSKRSYTFYIFHFIWVVLFQYLLFHVCNGNIILLYVLPVLLAYGATLLCCEICNRVSFFSFLR